MQILPHLTLMGPPYTEEKIAAFIEKMTGHPIADDEVRAEITLLAKAMQEDDEAERSDPTA